MFNQHHTKVTSVKIMLAFDRLPGSSEEKAYHCGSPLKLSTLINKTKRGYREWKGL